MDAHELFGDLSSLTQILNDREIMVTNSNNANILKLACSNAISMITSRCIYLLYYCLVSMVTDCIALLPFFIMACTLHTSQYRLKSNYYTCKHYLAM